MSIIQGTSKSSAATYKIDQSIRFNDGDSPKLTGSTGQTGDGTQWTISMWVKRGAIDGGNKTIWSAGDGSNKRALSRFVSGGSGQASEDISFSVRTGGSWYELNVNQSFRDPSAWYHFVWVWDSDNGTAADRMRIYVNGERLTSFSNTPSYPASGTATDSWNNSTYAHQIGFEDNTRFFDGYLAEMYHIDGQALTPASFGETNSDTGQWVPIDASGLTFGTRGFYLKGEDSSDLGNDSSGNNNDFTSSGLAAADQVTDSPTDNYVTLNPLQKGSDVTLSDGNLVADCGSGSSSTRAFATVSMPNSGKWTFQIEAVSSTLGGTDSISSIGIITNPEATNTDVTTGSKIGQTANQENAGLDFYNGFTKKDNASQITAAQLRNAGDKGIVAYDASTKKLWLGYAQSTDSSWTWVNGGDPETGTTPTYTMTNDDMRFAISSDRSKTIVRFGSTGDGIAPPSGFNYLNTDNLDDPTIADPADYFDIALWSGTNSSNEISDFSFQPDALWIKSRSLGTGGNHVFVDAVRGVGTGTNTKEIYPNLSNAESPATSVTSFDADGFTLTGESSAVRYNETGETYVGWAWKANGSGSSNTDGSITSTVSADTTSGFSIATYTGTGANATVGHGLGVAPSFVLVKSRNDTHDWYVWTPALATTEFLKLNSTAAKGTSSPEVWNSTAPTSSVVSLGTSIGVNRNTYNYVMYCFAEVEGFSKFGSYTGNGSTDGVFIHTGFEVGFLMYKRTNAAESWEMYDNTRGFNVHNFNLRANLGNAEQSDVRVDLLSNGWKARSSNTAINTSGHSYIYMALASSPFKTANAQ